MKIKLKKVTAFFVLALQLFLLTPSAVAQVTAGEKRKFLVTAYYSPLPGQSFYIRGSLEADIYLNGRGTNGADGTEVFTGMLAAPSTYPFGTRINIPGLGVGEVHDRGGAIIARADYDRIDVWMGHGEAGLSRAVNWGARMVEGEVWWNPVQVEPGLSFAGISDTLPESFIARLRQSATLITQRPPVLTPVSVKTPDEIAREFALQKEENLLRENQRLLVAGLGKNADGDDVEALQRMLWELGYYHGPISRRYDEQTIDAVFLFQQSNGILTTAYEKGAGYFGKQTHQALIAAIDERIEKTKEYPKEMQTWVPAKRTLPKVADMIASAELPASASPRLNFALAAPAEPAFLFASNFGPGARGESVKSLQSLLIDKGFLAKGLDTGYFGEQTRAALVKFQLAHDVVASAAAPGAGAVGPQTREALNIL